MTVETLEAAGLRRMDDDNIGAFLSNQRVGVLGLPTESGPYMIPLSFGYDGDSALYFTFVGGSASRKQQLTEAAADATVLVYKVESMFHWESVLLQGSIEAVPESEWDDLAGVLDTAWRPELFRDAIEDGDITVYRFHIDEREGLRHAGLPPGFEPE
ncbi:pyridoxamine 5'-phosphate oxidase [Haloarcula taiwanensis]|uniref:Pyridoxamine 5'-phosphate oxidase n=1 Tax=Haloarcula taiwanensis TaxID=1932004 RepID=A0A2H4ZUD6_9EURY|nr:MULTISPECIES: pyridoxamine 5'-phosphate oxidase family protein [Haloarcula]AUG46072.1 pyridoxamine 5'-phosphate oxidase [Haloarcula taiwanensis]RLM40203.1 pyridoxamine 5'-phosphate oxidase family protein [Haloarcula sp. Atlit-120R]RLM48234.1 pyridoxamine 5'-phosphate oxidase family protein [Haloarcula sp. Atlit-47R]